MDTFLGDVVDEKLGWYVQKLTVQKLESGINVVRI